MTGFPEPLYTKQGLPASAPRLTEWWADIKRGGRVSLWPHLIGAGFLYLFALPFHWVTLAALAGAWALLALARWILKPALWRRRNPEYRWLDQPRWRRILRDRQVTRLWPVVRRLDAAADAFHELITLARVGPWADRHAVDPSFRQSIFQPAGEVMDHLAGLAAVAAHADDNPVQLQQILAGMDRSLAALRNVVDPLRTAMTATDGAAAPDFSDLKQSLAAIAARAEAEAELLQLRPHVP